MKSKYRYVILSITLIIMMIGVALFSAHTFSVEANENIDLSALAGTVLDEATDGVDEYERSFLTKGEFSYDYINCEENDTRCILKNPPKNRLQIGPICWGISTMNSLEATLANKYSETEYGDTIRINPYHMIHSLEKVVKGENNIYGFRDEENYPGSSSLTTLIYLTNGTGFVTNNDFLYNANISNNSNPPFFQAYTLNQILTTQKSDYVVKKIQYVEKINNLTNITPNNPSIINRINDVKELISEGIGVKVISAGFILDECHDANTYGVYCSKEKINQYDPILHAVTIIGWDDNFAATDFGDDNDAPANGAWIVRNSWTYDNYFYISYYDYYAATGEMLAITEVSEKDYDYQYQYNPSGCNAGSTGCNSFQKISGKELTIFNKQDHEYNEKLTSIGFYANKKSQNTSVDVYFMKTDNNDYSNLFNNDDNKLGTVQINATGYYTYELSESITIDKKKFIIGLQPSESNVLVAQTKSNSLMNEIEVGILPGYSYNYSANEWKDTAINNSSTNFIKAFTTVTEDSYNYEAPIAVTGVHLDDNELNLDKYEIHTLTATVEPNNAEYKYVTWSTSDNTIVSVDKNGNITAKKPGTATITVTTIEGGFTDTCLVTVNAIEQLLNTVSISRIGSTAGEQTIKINEIIALKPIYDPSEPTNIKSVEWLLDNNNYLEILGQNDSQLRIKGKAYGQTTITLNVTTNDDVVHSATYDVTVSGYQAPPIENIELPEQITISWGESTTIDVTLTPDDAERAITWEISDPRRATIDENGVLTAIGVGTATITARSTKNPDIFDTCELIVNQQGTTNDHTVVNPTINVSDLTYNGTTNIPTSNITVTGLSQNQYNITSATLNNANAGTRQASITLELIDDNYIFDNNQMTKTFTVSVTVNKVDITTIITDNTSDVTVDYDGNLHSIEANIQSNNNDIIIKYMNLGGAYILSSPPPYPEPGTYIIKYKVYIDNNYTEYYGEKTLIVRNILNPYSISGYTIENNSIVNIDAMTELSTFTSHFTLASGCEIAVDTKNINNKTVLYTGGKTRITCGTTQYTPITNVVKGDTDGDGDITYMDFVNVYNHIKKVLHPESDKHLLVNEYLTAADMSGDNTITYMDYIGIYHKKKELKGGTN